MAKLSIVIPSRSEPLLTKTVEDIYNHIEGDTEVLYMEDDGRGQRALTNELVRRSKADFVMKVDAHCSFGPGFDAIMMEAIDDRTILSPQMGVLEPITWSINGKKMTSRYYFDKDFIMKYDENNDEMEPETMCLQGSAWMITRENYWKWNVCDESLGSWGGQAVELGIAAHINGGRCKTTRNTYYGHVFRHSDIEFPYDRGESPGKFATEELKRRYKNDPRIEELSKKFGKEWYNSK